jgi:hypothetical protein
MSSLTGFDLSTAPLEVNVFHYPPGGLLGAHADLRDKIVTHVLYFNQSWNDEDGGCLSILRSSDPRDIVKTVSPVVGNSAVLVRSDDSWHAVSPVVKGCRLSRRSLTATFYHAGAVSTMWPRRRRTAAQLPEQSTGALVGEAQAVAGQALSCASIVSEVRDRCAGASTALPTRSVSPSSQLLSRSPTNARGVASRL